MIGDTVSLTFSYVDDLCKDIYRGSVVGIHVFQLRVHKFQAAMHLNDHFARLLTTCKYEYWYRTVEYRLDGTIIVALKQCIGNFIEGGVYVCRVQDVTEAFQHYL